MFEHLELEENDREVTYQVIQKEIPDNQFLTYSDLKIINPDINTLKLISFKIIQKYNVIPLFVLIHNNKPVLPKHLNSEYWGNIEGFNKNKLYIASPKPFDNQILNIVRTITKYSIINIPIKEKDAKEYIYNNCKKTIFRTKDIIRKKNNLKLIIKFTRENYLYILGSIILIISLISLKLFIEN